MTKLRFVKPALNLSNNIAIVGSSGSICNKEWGSIIDQYDDVIRFNRAPVENYETWIGKRTTLRVVNNHVFINHPAMKEFTNQPSNFVKNLRNNRILYMGPGLNQKHKEKHTHASNDVFVFKFKNRGNLKQVIKFEDVSDPSLGCMMIGLCVVVGIKPSLFGFDIEISDNTRSHYWEERPGVGPYHNANYEKQLISRLADNDKITVFK